MQIKFEIPFRLPSLNDYIKECRNNKYGAATYKKQIENNILWVLKNVKQKVHEPITVNFIWYEGNYKRDKDNVCSAKKYILDALQKSSILPNDNNRYILGFTDSFVYNQGNKVIVILETFYTENLKKLEVIPK